MKSKPLVTTILTTIFATTLLIAQSGSKDDIAKVHEAGAQFQSTRMARSAGYDLIPGLDYCFQSYGVGGLGYIYINTDLLDTTVDLEHPEALIYAPDPKGSIQLGAVGYMVPATAWDANQTEFPRALNRSFHLDQKLGMYILLAWIWKNNPNGIFEDWNPNVSCPEPLPWKGPRRWR